MRFQRLVIALLVSLLIRHAHADVVAQWDFNSSPSDDNVATGAKTPSVGAGTLMFLEGTFESWAAGSASDPATMDNSAARVTGFAPSTVGDLTRGLQFNVSTAGYEGIQLSFDLRHDSSSSKHGAIQYSLDGVNFVTHSYFTANNANTYYARTVDLSSIPDVNENSSFAIRIVSAFEKTATGGGSNKYVTPSGVTYSAGGAWMFDNVTISGTSTLAAVPENSAWILCSASAVVACLTARLRSMGRNKRKS